MMQREEGFLFSFEVMWDVQIEIDAAWEGG